MRKMSKYFATSLWLAGAYFLTGWLGLSMPAVGTVVTLLWLPTGIAVAVLYRSGYSHWPAVTIASFVLNLFFGQSFPCAAGISIGNTLGPMLAVWLLHKLRFDAHFARNRDIAILAAAGHVGMTITASGGTAALFLSGLPRHEVFNTWMCWWGGDSMGIIAAAPLLLVANRTAYRRILEKALSEVSLGVLMTDKSQNVTYMNTGFTSLTGYEESDLLGKNCRILQGKETDRSIVARVKSEIDQGRHFDGEILNYRKDGTPFWNALLITAIHDDVGEHVGFLGIQRDISAKKTQRLLFDKARHICGAYWIWNLTV